LGREQLELVLELLQTFRGEDYVLRQLALVRSRLAAPSHTKPRNPAGKSRPRSLSERSSIAWHSGGSAKAAAALCRQHGGVAQRCQRFARQLQRVGPLQRLLERLRLARAKAQTRHVPRVELAQIARRTRLAEMFDRTRNRPVELRQHLRAQRRT